MGKASRAKAARKGDPQSSVGKKHSRRPRWMPAGDFNAVELWLLSRWGTIAIGLAIFAVFVLTADYSAKGRPNDIHWSAVTAWSIAKVGSLNLEFAQRSLEGARTWLFNVGPLISGSCADGTAVVAPGSHCRSDRFPGTILLAVPFYVVFAGPKVFSILPATLAAVTATTVALIFLYRALLRIARPSVAFGALFLTAFGTSMWTVSADALWTHAGVMLGLGVGTWAMSRQNYATAGLGYAFAILSRPHSAVFALCSGLWESWAKRSWIPAAKVGLVSSAGIALLIVYNKINAGKWALVTGSYSDRPSAALTAPGAATGTGSPIRWLNDITGALVSPYRGWFLLSPFLLLLLPGLVRAWKDAPSWVRGSALGGVIYFLLQLVGNRYLGGEGFYGYRVTLEGLFGLIPLLTISFVSWTAVRKWRLALFSVLAALSVWGFAWGAMFYRVPQGSVANSLEFSFAKPFASGAYGQVLLAALLAAVLVSVVGYVWKSSSNPTASIKSRVGK